MPAITDFIPIYTALAAAVALTVPAVAFRHLTVPAAVAAAVMLVAAALFWGYAGIVLYAAPFLLNAVFGRIGRNRRKQRETKLHSHSGARGLTQVLCNGLPTLIMMGAAFFTGAEALYAASAAALAEGFADSEAGDFGMAFGGKTVSILTFRECERGLSGGISAAGSIAAVLSAAAAALIPVPFSGYGWAVYGAVIAGAVSGVTADSLLGASVQALYRCPECGTLTEKRYCCRETQLIRGIGRMDNNAVNMISGFVAALFGGGIAAIILYL